MNYKISWRGVELTAPTKEEAIAIARELVKTDVPPGVLFSKRIARTRPADAAPPPPPKSGFNVDFHTAAFLAAIIDSGGRGANTERIQGALGASHPKGVGSRARYVNELLDELGFREGQVYTNDKIPGQARLWKPGPKIQDAASKVRERMNRG